MCEPELALFYCQTFLIAEKIINTVDSKVCCCRSLQFLQLFLTSQFIASVGHYFTPESLVRTKMVLRVRTVMKVTVRMVVQMMARMREVSVTSHER